MKHDDRTTAELLEVIHKTKLFLEQEKKRGLERISVRSDTWSEMEQAVKRAYVAEEKRDTAALLKKLETQMDSCSKCHLAKERTNIVFGEGNPHARLVFVGEAPGRDEDEQGRPFVGKAGQLLTKIIEAIEMTRDDVYICNILKCRPPKNRTPTTIEIECCIHHLMQQLDAIRPKIICALGNVAAQTLLNTKAPMNRIRGRFHQYGNILLMPTYHPAALLRNPAYKRSVWEDVQIIQRECEKL